MKHIILALAFLAGSTLLASAFDPIDISKDERRSLRIIQTTPLQFPQALIQRGITSGSARIALAMDRTGVLTDVLVVGYSHEEFADAAEHAVREWSYEPMRVLAENVATQTTLLFNFEAKGVVISIDMGTALQMLMPALRSEKGYGPCPLERLDSIPTPLAFIEPAYSTDLKQRGVEGQAEIEFYIDESGSVRVPAVVDADFWELGVLAMEAVRQWRFASPTSRGRPVLVRARQTFYFGQNDG